ncbi:ATP-binding protein [Kibdelosporangium phytohabitans]|uniref:HTH luxR-type domain-containing protein n=1 Tax=Kibdelosporangium phytohabitans TaxID=860235 RepID=A0A0N9I1E9_9PSEU|nr:LuxR C-terminal-related transcriptional regulator [Kibdelosporangium phytohabitans]ALG09637.1 hypothetical protein AOZ06_24470 [Kibdelosporangium phytohabitans]MBE1469021.1 non-specific serine/threonine protein kinase [Kibdelosporangium phytohabitans]
MSGVAHPAVSAGLMEVTSYVGRRGEHAEVRRLLGSARLITLTGPGGVGKTRLAARLLRDSAKAFQDGAVFAGFAELRDPALVPALVADRVGLHDRSDEPTLHTVVAHLRDRATLLVLDNCEHLVGACAALAEAVLLECPRVVVLATSRQSLGVQGEQIFPVPPLRVPEEDTIEPSDYDSVQLFQDRASAVVPSFRVRADNSADVARLCRQLEGLPLAIELAAARIRSLSPRQIAERLTRRLALLTSGPRTAPERQQTLRATIEWSYQLCSEAEQRVWRRVSVFAGSFDLDAAEFVCAEPGAVLDLVDGLLDKSVLLREQHDDVARYRMLETLREYGQEELRRSGDLPEAGRRHRDWFDRTTGTADAEWFSSGQVVWVARLRRDHANLRAALEWSLTEPGEAAVALRMAARVNEYWTLRGSCMEGRGWLDRALAATPAGHPDRPLALSVNALHALWLFDVEVTEARLAEAGQHPAGPASTHLALVRSLTAMLQGQFAEAAELATSAAAACRAHGDLRREVHPLFIKAVSTAVLGDLAGARRGVRKMLALTGPVGDAYYHTMSLYAQAVVEVLYGDPVVARRAALAGVGANLTIGSRFGAAHHVEALAWACTCLDEHLRSATLLGIASRLWDLVGMSPEAAKSLSTPHFEHLRRTRKALGAARFDEARATGRALPEDQAMDYVLDGPSEPVSPTARPRTDHPLTARELEIAGLVAEGLSNREIAARLVISLRTAETHVQHILTKLDTSNRTQIARWFATRRT